MDTPQDQSQSTPKQQVVERLKQANNVLVTVKSSPNVDELAAAIGLTLMLNKLEKHTTAVFSGEVPSTLEFLKPEETIETNTDSLRDFIVSLDKSKADKLRYKVEENVVRIYITPYRTSISEQDLEFTQGDFNVDAVVALGVTQREELDQAITNHGRILHDATVITVTAGQDVSELGQINWQEPAASSLSEMLVSISEAFQGGLIDEQIATAYLTGIVAETERFSNTKTSPKVMTMAAQLMAAGANQQLIANELEKAVEVTVQAPEAAAENVPETESAASSDGTLSIKHDKNDLEKEAPKPAEESETKLESEPAIEPAAPLVPPSEKETSSFLPPLPPRPEQPEAYNPLIDAKEPETMPEPESQPVTEETPAAEPEQPTTPEPQPAPEPQTQPEPAPAPELPPLEMPDLGTELTESKDDGQIHIDHEGNLIRKEAVNPKHKAIQPLGDTPHHEQPGPAPASDTTAPQMPDFGIPAASPASSSTQTLEQIEQSVRSPHLNQQTPPVEGVDSARNAVESALGQGSFDAAPAPRADLNAMPLPAPAPNEFPLPGNPAGNPGLQPLDGLTNPPLLNQQPEENDPMAPPPVPPPMFPQA